MLKSTRLLQQNQINMQLLLLEKYDCYHTETVFDSTIRFDLQIYETRFRYEGVLGQIDIQWLSETQYRIIRLIGKVHCGLVFTRDAF